METDPFTSKQLIETSMWIQTNKKNITDDSVLSLQRVYTVYVYWDGTPRMIKPNIHGMII